jgi:cbb3-type cytochrome oxidase subunit 3
VLTLTDRHLLHHVARRADHRARHRQRHVADHLLGHRRRLPRAVLQTFEQMRTGQLGLLRVLFLIVFMALVIAAIVFVERAHRRVTVQYAKRVVGGACTAGRARTSR